jgi:diphosphomevalonate decarboxylase
MRKSTWRAGSNIAFIKYWGVADVALNLPLNNSISMTLADAHTTTTVEWDEYGQQTADEFTLDHIRLDEHAAGAPWARLARHMDCIRALAGVNHRVRVVSHNNFPAASGIASSASGFAALTVAACDALGLNLDIQRLSALARRGSGSASRSLFAGFVEWERGYDDASSVAHALHPPDHWALYDLVAIVSGATKQVSSERGHRMAATSPLLAGRLACLPAQLDTVRQALAERDLRRLGPVLEQDALAMHAVMMTSTPSLLYWQPATLEILHAVPQWRADGLAAYFTIDAGPNVHLLCEERDVAIVQKLLESLPGVQRVIASRPGSGPLRLNRHLF